MSGSRSAEGWPTLKLIVPRSGAPSKLPAVLMALPAGGVTRRNTSPGRPSRYARMFAAEMRLRSFKADSE